MPQLEGVGIVTSLNGRGWVDYYHDLAKSTTN